MQPRTPLISDSAIADARMKGTQRKIRELSTLCVHDIMTRNVVALRPSDDLGTAKDVLRLGHFRHLPVVDRAGKIVGLLTHRDILRVLAEQLRRFSSKENRWFRRHRIAGGTQADAVMQRGFAMIHPDAPLVEAARAMRRHQYGCLPVAVEGKLVGIVTEADFLNLVATAFSKPFEGTNGQI